MTTDRELLELAAKAAGYCICEPLRYGEFRVCNPGQNHLSFAWSPLTDDGDALRLAVKLKMEIVIGQMTVCALVRGQGFARETIGQLDPLAATRRAIVSVAAIL